jgi:hypothetical protein
MYKIMLGMPKVRLSILFTYKLQIWYILERNLGE